MSGEDKIFGGSLVMVSRAYQEYKQILNRNLIASLSWVSLIRLLRAPLLGLTKSVKRRTPSLTQHAGTRLSKNIYLSRDL